MTATVFSHPGTHRKHGRAWVYAAGALAALAFAALAAVSWLTPQFTPAPPAAPPAALKLRLQDIDVALDLVAPAPPVEPRRVRRPRVRAPVQAAAVSEGFEVLSAAELDAISQARPGE